jgi:hypothetical protein
MAAVAGLIAHGGLWGAIAEGLIAVAVVGLLVAVWLRERRVGEEETVLSEDDEARRTPHTEAPPR